MTALRMTAMRSCSGCFSVENGCILVVKVYTAVVKRRTAMRLFYLRTTSTSMFVYISGGSLRLTTMWSCRGCFSVDNGCIIVVKVYTSVVERQTAIRLFYLRTTSMFVYISGTEKFELFEY